MITPDEAMLTDEGMNAHRDAYGNAIQSVSRAGQNSPQMAAALT